MAGQSSKSRAVRRRRGSIIEIRGARGVSYKIKFDLPNPAGERRTHYKTIKGTREEAEAELARLTGQASSGVDLASGKQTLAGWIAEWLRDHAGRNVTTRTAERYGELLNLYVVPRIGKHPLAVLSPRHIDGLYSHLETAGRIQVRKDGAMGLHPRTVRHVHRVLFQCLGDARRFKMIADNPVADARPPRLRSHTGNDEAVEMHPLNLERMMELLAAVKAAGSKSVPYPLAMLAFDSGARRGELLALRRSDFDFDECTMRIDRAVGETKADGVTVNAQPKNDYSRRTVTLSKSTVETLREWILEQAELRLKIGMRATNDALLFPLDIEKPDEPLRPREVTKAFGRIVSRDGFAPFRFHDFRHSCASFLLNSGMPITDVSRQLGHADPSITLRVYSHCIQKNEAGIGLLDRLAPGMKRS